jgi:hypothetical protein
MTPLVYHTIGQAVAAASFCLHQWGPRDIRGWVVGRWGAAAYMLIVALAWPLFGAAYGFALLVWGCQQISSDAWDWIMQGIVYVGMLGAVIALGYGLIYEAIPFLAHWYGLT